MTPTMSLPPGVTLDPKAESELEAEFGVASNAEELIRANRARFTPEMREAAKKSINEELTATLFVDGVGPPDGSDELDPAIAEAIGHPIRKAVVRGVGRSAAIIASQVFSSAPSRQAPADTGSQAAEPTRPRARPRGRTKATAGKAKAPRGRGK